MKKEMSSKRIIRQFYSWVALHTRKFRHQIVKWVAPGMYKISSNFFSKLYETPRPMILFLKEYFKNKPLVGAEIGVGRGDNALSILKEVKIKKFTLLILIFLTSMMVIVGQHIM
jgi:hypothetical protein